MIVRVPGSSANLGPGFDALGLAVTMHLEAGPLAAGATVPPRDPAVPGPAVIEADEEHPLVGAYRSAGGRGRLWVRSSLPPGRGLGFSGAARVAGLVLAVAQREGEGFELGAAAGEVLSRTAELEGHADNVAASVYGGVVATAGGRVVRVPLALEPAVVVWVPPSTTSTRDSRARLASSVRFADAAFNVGRTALLVAALAAGDVDVLRVATEDRLHQDVRFAAAPRSRAALQAALAAGAWCGWLSGSGPSVAVLCAADDAERVAGALPEGGRAARLSIDADGAVLAGG